MSDAEDYGDYEDEDAHPIPLDRREAASVKRDLEDLSAFRRIFEPEGIKGVSLYCQDCLEEHFYGWDMLENNLRALLESGETPVHEPAYDPRPDEYVDWEYAQGYLDGMADNGGFPHGKLSALGNDCPFCGEPLPDRGEHAAFCPSCGRALAPVRIAQALLERGWSEDDVEELLRVARVPPMRAIPRERGRS
jgi:hypothetical protein